MPGSKPPSAAGTTSWAGHQPFGIGGSAPSWLQNASQGQLPTQEGVRSWLNSFNQPAQTPSAPAGAPPAQAPGAMPYGQLPQMPSLNQQPSGAINAQGGGLMSGMPPAAQPSPAGVAPVMPSSAGAPYAQSGGLLTGAPAVSPSEPSWAGPGMGGLPRWANAGPMSGSTAWGGQTLPPGQPVAPTGGVLPPTTPDLAMGGGGFPWSPYGRKS